MLNKVCAFIRQYDQIQPGDSVVCAVSGGADSVALLWAMYLLREKLEFTLSAAHYNHGLRGVESDRDQAFVEELCSRYDIPLHIGRGNVQPGEKGLEAAAREARYTFLESLSGKIATAHTADDNSETVLMHMIRGTGLKGLGGISPVRNRIIRPMLNVTRQEVVNFLQEYCLSYVEDSSNETDAFLRNRIRHHIMPLLKTENPSLAEKLSQMALRLRQDEEILQSLTEQTLPDVKTLRQMPRSLLSRYLTAFLQHNGVKEPEAEHIALLENLVFSDKPSASGDFPGGITICRQYDRLVKAEKQETLCCAELTCPGVLELPDKGVRIVCQPGMCASLQWDHFTVYPQGPVMVRARKSGDSMRLQGGTKSVKALMIDRKIPAAQRDGIPVLADHAGVLAVLGLGANLDRTFGEGDPWQIRFETIEK